VGAQDHAGEGTREPPGVLRAALLHQSSEIECREPRLEALEQADLDSGASPSTPLGGTPGEGLLIKKRRKEPEQAGALRSAGPGPNTA
jgi:hypothetical protein